MSWLVSGVSCKVGLGAVLGVEIVADLARPGTEIFCRGEITSEMEGEDAQRAARSSPALELAPTPITTLNEAEGDTDDDVNTPDG